ncbi:Vi polysaccharide biosynthesis UDP-N-acetylglucosamine C-6 dehydrogenase TviB [Urechidicola sp. KH5]
MNTVKQHQSGKQLINYPTLAYKKNNLYKKLINKKHSVAVVGLGYVGLPLAIHMASKFKVNGYDCNVDTVMKISQKIDPCNELSPKDFTDKDIIFSSNEKILQHSKFYIVTVPTPIDELKKPNLGPLKSATATIAKYLKKGDYVVFESTVFPGCTEEICVPILERISRLSYKKDFSVGYSPERINPGDSNHTFTKIKKIVSGSNEEALNNIAAIYDEILESGIHKAPSIVVAESAKVVENIQRDVNIGLMNELSQIFGVLNINTKDVLEAASTKWNFHNYFPGLVGGHCIGVDPYYLISKAKENKYTPRLLEQVREVNEGMINHIIHLLERKLYPKKFLNAPISILVRGITFKENVNDIRNSKTAELSVKLTKKGYNVIVQDYLACPKEVKRRYGLNLVSETKEIFDVIILAVEHEQYKDISYMELLNNGTSETLIFDIRGNKRNRIPKEVYMSL